MKIAFLKVVDQQVQDIKNHSHPHCKEKAMEWKTPKFEEICLNCEINSYANAQL